MKNEQTIIIAIHNIKSNKGSFTAGIDKVNIDKYLQMDITKLINLIRKCIDNYKPNAVRGCIYLKEWEIKTPWYPNNAG